MRGASWRGSWIVGIAGAALAAGCSTLPAPNTRDVDLQTPFVTVQWDPVPGAVGYRLEVARNAVITPETMLNYSTDTAEPEADLTEKIDYGVAYYYRVAPRTGAGPYDLGTYSGARKLQAVIGPPRPLAPRGAQNGEPQPVFTWERPAFSQNTFELQVSSTAAFATVIREGTTKGMDVFEAKFAQTGDWAPFPYAEPLYWRIRTVWKGSRFGPWSAPMEFRIDYFRPTLLAPAEGEKVATLNPRLVWTNNPHPTGYEVMITDRARFSDDEDLRFRVGADPRADTRSFEFYSFNLKPQTAYRWRVRSLYGEAQGEWSEPATFTIPPEQADNFTTSLVQKTPDRHEEYPQLSPAGDELLFQTYERSASADPGVRFREEREGEMTIWIKRIATVDGQPQFQEAIERFTEPQPKLQTVHPAWDPTGRLLYFASNRYDFEKYRRFAILSQERNALAQTTIIAPVPSESFLFPAVAPDGKTITYTVEQDGLWSLWTCNVNGTAKTSLTRGGQGKIAPDGSKIVFVSDRDGTWGLYTVTTRGGQVTCLHPAKSKDVQMRDPAWSRDGLRIAFSSNQAGNWDIYVYDTRTQQVQQITQSLARDVQPVWGPDDRYILFVSRREADTFDLWYTMLPESAGR